MNSIPPIDLGTIIRFDALQRWKPIRQHLDGRSCDISMRQVDRLESRLIGEKCLDFTVVALHGRYIQGLKRWCENPR